MATDRRYRTLAILFGAVLACTAVSFARALTRGLAPFWAVCCYSLGMNAHGEATSWLAILAGAATAGLLLFGFGTLAARAWKTWRFVCGLRSAGTTAPPGRLARLLNDLGLSRHAVVLATDVPLAFCFGLLRPRLCLSTGLAEALTDRELKAVLLHEDHHRRHFDPFRGLLAEAVGKTLFFLPIVTELTRLFLTSTELEADRHAVRIVGRPSLAGALHKLLTHPLNARLPIAGIAGISATDIRIAELLSDRPTALRPSGHSLVTTSTVLLLACMLTPGPLF